MSPDLAARVRNLTREQKLAVLARAAEIERDRRDAETRGPAANDGSRVVRVPGPSGRPLAYRLSVDDLAL